MMNGFFLVYFIVIILIGSSFFSEPMAYSLSEENQEMKSRYIVESIPIRGGLASVAVNTLTNMTYITNFYSGNVTVIDGNSDKIVKSFDVVTSPFGIAINQEKNMIYVGGEFENVLSVVNGYTNEIEKHIEINDPYDIAVNSKTDTIYVTSDKNNSLFVIDGQTLEIVTTLKVMVPCGVAVNQKTGMVYVTSESDNQIHVIDGSLNQLVAKIDVGQSPRGVTVNPNTNIVYVTNQESNTISVIDGFTNTVIDSISVGEIPRRVVVNPKTNLIYVTNHASNNLSVIDGFTNTVIETIPVNEPFEIAINPKTNKLYTVYTGSGRLSLISHQPISDKEDESKITSNLEDDYSISSEKDRGNNVEEISKNLKDILIFKFECIGERLFLQKLNTERLYCVKHTTAEKLIDRGWGEFPSLTFSDVMEKSDKQYIMKIFSECYKDVDCVIDNLKDFSKNNDKISVINTLSDIISVYEENIVYCHTSVHHLGHFLTNYLGEISDTMPYLDSRCGGGLYHGVFESYFEKLTEDKLEEDIVHGICQTYPENEFSRDRWECLHALGHGLMKFYADDAIYAAEYCGNLENQWATNSCSKGVFMENQIKYSESSGGTFDENDVFYPCNTVDSQYAPACYTYQAGHVLVVNSYSKTDSFETCDMITPEEYVKYCYRGLGKDLARETFNDLKNSLNICSLGQQKYQSDCLMGTVRVVIDHLSLEKGFEYCEFYPDEFKTDCYDLLGKWIHMLFDTEDQITIHCSTSENTKYFQICMDANLRDWKLI